MDLNAIRDTLLQAIEEQYAADKEANETAYRLGQQKIMYNNDARGTLYSGQPTWERAQLAANNLSNIATTDSNYMKSKLSVWEKIADTLDKINSYNRAAKEVTKSGGTGETLVDVYNGLGGK